jgi:multiple sugar transport system substrate-binding protein
MRLWYVSQSENASGVLPALAYEFNKSNPWGITVEVTAYDNAGDLSSSVEAARYKNDLPDLLAGYNYQAKTWDKDGKVFVDLNEYVDDPVWGFSIEEQADFYPVFWQQDVTPTKRLGLPLRRTVVGLYYNVTWAKELGFDSPPDTPEAFRTQACAAAMASADGTGGWIITTEPSALLGWVFAFGGDILTPDGKGYRMERSENQEALMFLKGMEEQGCAWVAESRYPNAEFAGRQGLFLVGNSAGLLYQEEAFASLGANDHWVAIPFPGVSRPPVVDVYGPALMITRSTPARQLAAWVFARWLVSPEAQASWIRAGGGVPVRNATRGLLGDYATSHPQWTAFVYLLPYAQPEPSDASWDLVRWMVADMSEQLFSPDFTAAQIPALLQIFDRTAAEAAGQP